ncbi:hypothetical protein DRP53_03820 [candidate division WOR-3 bacterium]|uniref:Uncharacterized protein n=1 Tax=candidate division WOR-3 bacterium TaxID=2052148 RepID=A0A660SL99_UNCW3|nr:MAG: hypothetical protein DRP53_03820 [candidate division WOR-3 bacterium]
MKEHALIMILGILILSAIENVLAEETVGCPHDVGKGKFKIRSKVVYLQAQRCYSDEVWKALHKDSPYPEDYDKMVDLPDDWHLRKTGVAMGLEYGIVDRLGVGIFLPYVMKDLKRQVWSKEAKKTVWKEVRDDGLEDLWLSAKYLVYSKSPGLWGFDWKDGLFLAFSYKPSISSDEKIKNGIGSGTDDFKVVILSHPHFTENLFLCGDVWYQYRGKVKEIDGLSRSGWDLGDRFGYRSFIGYEFGKFAIVAGPQGWIARGNKDRDGSELEDSETYSHGMVAKFRWQPSGDEEAGSIDLGVRIPYADKAAFAPVFMPTVCGRIKF